MIAHPLVPFALAFVLGSALGLQADRLSSFSRDLPIIAFGLLLVSFLPSFHCSKRAHCVSWFLRVSAVFIFAFGMAVIRDEPLDATREILFSRAHEHNRPLYVSGEVTAIRPSVKATFGEQKYRFYLKNPSIRGSTNEPCSVRLPGSLSVIWYGRPLARGGYAPRKGERWELKGKVYSRRNADPNSRDMHSLFLVSRHYSTRILSTTEKEDFLARLRETGALVLSQGLDAHPEERSLILAMTLGLRAELPKKLTEAFRRAGTIHIFAISGLHVVVVAGILAFALGTLGISRHRWFCFLAPFITGYVILTGAPASAMRAGLMVGLYYLGPLLGRKPDPLNTLSATVILLLLFSPLQLRELGFILSFSMVLGLILCAGPFVRLCKILLHVDALRQRCLLLEEGLAAGERSIRSVLRRKSLQIGCKLVEGAADTLGVSIAAAFISVPLTAFYFDMFVPFSILANIVVVPISGVVMLSAAMGLVGACLFLPLAVPFNLLAAMGAWLMKTVSRWVAFLPGASAKIVFPLRALVAWYVSLMVLVWILRRNLDNIGKNSDKNHENEPDGLTSEI